MQKANSNCCDTQQKQTLKPLDEVLDRLRQLARPTSQIETLSLLDAHNRVLAEDLYSELSVPPADNSAVDGYALHTDDFELDKEFVISQRIPAGHEPASLKKGTTARIFTGASIPKGANCVIMQERASLGDDSTIVSFSAEPKVQQNIRPKGQDIEKGQIVLRKGQVLTPARIGLAASIGIPEIKIFRRLKVAIFSTGDELVEPGETPKASQIYNSNRYLLSSMLTSLNLEIVDLGVIPDRLDSTTKALQAASSNADIIISTGGASVGEEDHVQTAIKSLGTIDFWRVAIKPGKPFMYGEINSTPVLGLPGNPGAVFVTFAMLARPFVLSQQGVTETHTPSYKLPLAFDVKKTGPRREFLRVKRDTNNSLIKHPNQSSGMLSSASWAEGFAVIPEHTAPKAGEEVEFIPLSGLFTLPM